MLNVGIVGVGFMGMVHYLAFQKVAGAKVRAISTRNPKRLAGDWRGVKGNFGPAGEVMDLRGVAKYGTLDELLADPTIDLVDFCLPPAQHADATIAALQAGKHVFVEKPIALTAADAQRMVKAAEKAGRMLLVGHVLPFVPEYAFAYRAVRDGKYDKPLGGMFKRVISDPKWLPDYYHPQKVGGPMLDLHIHDAHLIRLLYGMPTSVFSQGRMRGKVVEFAQSQFRFADPDLVVGAVSGVVRQQGRSFTNAFEMYFENATLIYDFAVLGEQPHVATPLTVLDARGKVTQPKLGSSDPLSGFVAELKEVVRAVRAGKPSTILSDELACDAVVLCDRQAESVKTGKAIKINR